MQRRYAARRDRLVAALARELGSDVDIGGDAAGMHLIAWLPRLARERLDALVDACRARGIGVYSLERHAIRPLTRQALILGYGLVSDAAIDEGIRGLADEYRTLRAA
jgi:GntR family transcriptional regulator / MocR family aminotransferase